jgi:hypothetical protein
MFANLNILGQINFPGSFLSSEVKGQSIDGKIVKQTGINHCKITCQSEVVSGAGNADCTVEGYWTLYL